MYQPVPSTVDFPALEREILDFWDKTRAFDKLVEKNAAGPRWSFVDGPITANNPMGVHHAWGRTYKDVYQRYYAMQGYQQRFQNGFDCQGLWVEVEVEKELGFNAKWEIEEYGLDRFSEKCKERVERYADVISKQSIRLGQWMHWDDSYYTHTDNNIEHIWHFLKTCHEKGWLYQGARSMPWCIRCGTGLSQHELVGTDSYRELTHTSVYIALPIVDRPNEHFLVWTTTPWTLPANVALAVHPELEYVKIRQGEKLYYLSPRTTGFLKGQFEEVGRLTGSELVGLRFHSPFEELPAQQGVEHPVIAWEDVGEEEGTGVVHIAPGCGAEDYELSKVHNLKVITPIDEAGVYVDGFGELSAQSIRATNDAIFASLRSKGLLYTTEEYQHRYPCCWRCGEELAFRLAAEWFIRADEIRPLMKAASETVNWVPASAGKRMDDWLNNMGDWNISRKRYWGLPLPFYRCSCGELTVIGSKAELAERAVSGMDQLKELHRPWIDDVTVSCASCGAETKRILEVGDAWLDAGIVPFSTLNYLHDPEYWAAWYPAHFITEMREQIRLWFYSMLFMSVTLKNQSPYQSVLAFEKLMDEHGKPMHKSSGNAIWFDDAAERMGADPMRWLYCGQNVQNNLNFGFGPAEEVKRRLLVLWNVYSFFVTYARIDGFNPNDGVPALADRSLLDRWIISRLNSVIADVRAGLDRIDAAAPTRTVERFVDDLSTWYVRRSRRRFWKAADDADKRAAQATLYEVLTSLTRILAPFLPFLAESVYQNLVRSVDPSAPESVHHTCYPEVDASAIDVDLERQVEIARRLVGLGRAAREQAAIKNRQPLALARVGAPAGVPPLPDQLREEIESDLNVWHLEIGGDIKDAVAHAVQAKPALIGPRLGRKVQDVLKALRAGEQTIRPDGSVEVAGELLNPEEVTISTKAKPGFAAAESDGYTLVLDTRLSPELIQAGLARELVHRIQTMRKDAGFEVEDRIVTRFDATGELAGVFDRFGEYIKQETLSVALEPNGSGGGHDWSGQIEGEPVTIRVALAGGVSGS
ncbi:MAG TPA: isoleucine--tRNA ligase [Chloroflexota bacterium]|nr:isoleucine--tRNA ligase [Chloroflexota bacterium]